MMGHKAIPRACAESDKYKMTYMSVDTKGRVDHDDVRRAVTPATFITSVVRANHEVRTVKDPIAISGIWQAGVLFHSDAVGAVGRIPVDVESLDVDPLKRPGHKLAPWIR